MNENMSKFTGERNRVKRVNLVLGGIKLGCHFLCPKLWNEAILTGLNIGLEGIEKYSRILFGLFMDKGHNQMIHEKYKMSRYRSVSRIKIINSKNL